VAAGGRASRVRAARAVAGAGARWDHPVVQSYARGDGAEAARIASDPDELARAVSELQGRVYAKTAQGPLEYKLARWAAVARAAGHIDPWAFTEQLITDVMAALVKAQFRSADGYLDAARQAFIGSGGQLTDTLRQLCRNMSRAARRGRGPAKRSLGLPLERCGELDGGSEPWARNGPAHPRAAIVIGAWWLLREIELSAVRLEHVSDRQAAGMHILLPASKCDVEGNGTSRSHVCVCDLAPAAANICPACTLQAHVATRKRELGKHVDWHREPLFPARSGMSCTKAGVQATIVAAAEALGLDAKGPTGVPLFTGHALRATGAMFLAAAGLDANSVGLLGRWGSDVVRIYMREAPLRALQAIARVAVAPAAAGASGQLGAAAWAPMPGTPAAALCTLEPFVINTKAHGGVPVVHVVSFEVPAYAEPRSKCGWRFGRAAGAARRVAAVPEGALCCERCRHKAPVQSGSESSSASSSSESGS
jgi:hypothetical protein